MTLDGFMCALAKTPRDWRLRNRKQLRRGADAACPIDAVARRDRAWMRARPLELGVGTRNALIAAADGQYGHDKKLRARLLKACGLAP